MTMRKSVKKNWVKDLRSPSFPQTDGRLVGPALIEDPTEEQREAADADGDSRCHDDEVTGYCCLGVLTHQAIRSGDLSTILRWSPHDPRQVQVWENPDDEFATTPNALDADGHWKDFPNEDLPVCVAKWAGIDDEREGDPERSRLEEPNPANPLIGKDRAVRRNDTLNESFAQIAEAIEADEFL